MLRPTSKCRKPWKHMIYTYELEPRHMDSKIRRIDDDNFLIYTAGSDAFWRYLTFVLLLFYFFVSFSKLITPIGSLLIY